LFNTETDILWNTWLVQTTEDRNLYKLMQSDNFTGVRQGEIQRDEGKGRIHYCDESMWNNVGR